MPRHEIVVCTENTDYLVWQTMLFHYSCVTHLGRPPIVVVHQQGEPLLPGFEQIRAAGGRLQLAPNYRDLNGLSYPPRNTAGSLRHVETDADYIVLCDSDMLFLQPFPFDELILSDRQISFDYCGYLQPDAPEHQPTLDNVCRQAGINPRRLRKPLIDGGVPHVIPTRWQGPLSESWFEMMELFPTIGTEDYGQPRKTWLTAMWALVMSMHRLKLKAVSTRLCLSNFQEDQPLPQLDAAGPKVLHYCYGGPGFNKRDFGTAEAANEQVWKVPEDDGSIAGIIRRQLRDARKFYGIA